MGALFVSASLLSAPSASAADGDTGVSIRLYDHQTDVNSVASFTAYGDELQACDWLADGYGAKASLYKNVYNGNGTFIKSVSVGGKGNCRTNTQNVGEGTVVWIKLCITKDGQNLRCKWSDYGHA
ncbi:hypothetical protein [Streptomyces chartreusis]|uniref:Uncharacterized protein n=1 Tax=Streptomyces chartreusis TaxID=1969 RepID=A0A7H8T9S4_STRCX|nr:hypothetical protein [Streptomyces chartreusis]QKZ20243.1 hypothetical protein HUT05_24540 [Streptomyces chartreusis]